MTAVLDATSPQGRIAKRAKGTGTLVERSANRWLIRLEFGRDLATGKRDRRNVTFVGTKKLAQRKMNELLQERDSGTAVAQSAATVGEYLLGWLPRHHADGRISDAVLGRYAGIIKKHLLPALGSICLQDLRAEHISGVKSSWLAGGRGSTSPQPLAPATVYKHLTLLGCALEDAVRAGMIIRNPTGSVSRPSIKRREEQRSLTEEEISLLVAAARGTRFDVPIRFTLATGLRESELLSLRWKDVDTERRIVNVRGTKTQNSRRTVELSPLAVSMLKAHKGHQGELRAYYGRFWPETDLVFPSSLGTPWNKRTFYRDYKILVAKCAIEHTESVKFHTLRHTAASQWIRHGADIFTVSRRLGHASAAFTMDVYGHLLQGQQQTAAAALDHLLV